jgi:guanylate kinase
VTRKGSLIVISGFSGVGKGTIVEYIRTKYEDYEVSVSCTTRAPRENEVNGREYYFISRDEFLAKREKNGFIESAEYCGNLYGSPRPFVEEKLAEGKRVILEIEIQGAMNIRNQYPDAVLIFIMPPSAAELIARLTGRATETQEQILHRVQRASQEAEGIEDYDYIFVNDIVEDCAARIHDLVVKLEEAGTTHNTEFIEDIRSQINGYLKGE